MVSYSNSHRSQQPISLPQLEHSWTLQLAFYRQIQLLLIKPQDTIKLIFICIQDAKSHAMAGDLSLQGIRLPGREMEVSILFFNRRPNLSYLGIYVHVLN
jgi:hypothetical protein